jgi:hypothetical protein
VSLLADLVELGIKVADKLLQQVPKKRKRPAPVVQPITDADLGKKPAAD